MVHIYYQYTKQVTEDNWHTFTKHITVDCPELELLLDKHGVDVVGACVACDSSNEKLKK